FQPSLGRYDRSEFVAIVSPSGRAASAEVDHCAIFAVAAPDLDPDPISRAVEISALSPASGATGTAVTIYGSGFSPDPGKNTVMFEGPGSTNVAAEVLSATEAILETTVPAGAIAGKVFVR